MAASVWLERTAAVVARVGVVECQVAFGAPVPQTRFTKGSTGTLEELLIDELVALPALRAVIGFASGRKLRVGGDVADFAVLID